MSQDRIRGLNSPIGRLQFQQAKEQKVLTVEDKTEDEQDEIEKFKEIRAQKVQEQKRASPMAVSRLEILTGIGRLGREVPIEGITFSLRSLKGKELREVVVASAQPNISAFEQAFELRAQTLARSLYKIDGQPIDIVLGTDDLTTKIAFIQELDETVLSRLHDEYSAMMKEHNENVKDLGKTPEEVVDTVKKS